MRAVVRWLLGWVMVEVQCPWPERWFNLCGANGLPFWAVEPLGEDTVRLTLPRHRLKQAKALAEQALAVLTVVQEGGLPAFLLRFRRRTGMLAGAALFALLLTLLGQVVMVVDVEGNERMKDTAVIALLQRCGFGVGSYGPAVDVRELSNRALMEEEGLAFLTVDIRGIRARVIVREARPRPDIEDDRTPADVVAERDGWLVDIDSLAGQTMFQPGDAVLKGETVISHLLINLRRDGSGEVVSTMSVRAKGEVWAITRRHISAALPLTRLVPGETVSRRWGTALLGKRVNFFGNSSQRDRNCAKMTIRMRLRLRGGAPLPVCWREVHWREWTAGGETSPRQGAALLQEMLRSQLESALGEGQILSAQWQVQQSAGAVVVTLEARCLEQIGRSVDCP